MPQTQVLNLVTPTRSVLYAQKISPFRKIRTDFFVYFQLLRSIILGKTTSKIINRQDHDTCDDHNDTDHAV